VLLRFESVCLIAEFTRTEQAERPTRRGSLANSLLTKAHSEEAPKRSKSKSREMLKTTSTSFERRLWVHRIIAAYMLESVPLALLIWIISRKFIFNTVMYDAL
jgi:hypothetical protein